MEYLSIAIGVGFSVIGYLLSQKDKKQGEEIDSLRREIQQGRADFISLQLHIAGDHYKAQTIDFKFAQIDVSIKEGFKELREDIKALAVDIHGRGQ